MFIAFLDSLDLFDSTIISVCWINVYFQTFNYLSTVESVLLFHLQTSLSIITDLQAHNNSHCEAL